MTHVAHDRRRRKEAAEMSWNISREGKSLYRPSCPFSNIHEKVIHIDRGHYRAQKRLWALVRLAKHRRVGEVEGRRVGKWQKNYWRPRGIIILLTDRPLTFSRGFVLRMSGGCQFRPGRVCDAWEDERASGPRHGGLRNGA